MNRLLVGGEQMSSDDTGYIRVSGGLISSQFVSSMRGDHSNFGFALPSTFTIPWDSEDTAPDLKEYALRVSQAWEELKLRWDTYGLKLKDMDPNDVRKYWQRPLFEVLGFNIAHTQKQIEISDNLKFNFSHRGWRTEPFIPNPPVIHIIPSSQGLDERPVRGKPSAHDALQAYLNVHEDKWAILTNGRFLRLLRDFHHTFTLGYVEFDLEAIFLHRSYTDFQALYRFVHASRFAPPPSTGADKISNVYLEEYFNHSQTAGESVGKDLRENVVKAIEAFGNGFLNHELLNTLKGNETECNRYYNEILKAIYRIIFMLYAEQRGMLGGADGSGDNLYLEEYSITALRELAIERQVQDDRHTDLWEGLLASFKILKQGANKLGIYPYNGMLFDVSDDDYLSTNYCQNSDLLDAIRYLTVTFMGDVMQRISYADLSVEEIGAIYESLLDYTPRVTITAEEIEGNTYAANCFILDPRGSARKTTGSYYTNPALVQELIKSALEPVIKDRLENTGESIKDKEKELLLIRVCDPACGSGAFLIAACNRLGSELAKLRHGEDLPPQNILQEARRDVLQHCIYGVDFNPMAVELTKVSLWINAIVRDKPLNFLDHHIKCGNSLVGTTPELMVKGIPNEAFNPVEGDNKNVAQQFKKINREQLNNTTFNQWLNKEEITRICFEKFVELDKVDESDPQSVTQKKQQYEHLLHSYDYHKMKFLADLWTSAFFWKLDDKNAKVPTQGLFTDAFLHGDSYVPTETKDKVFELAKEYRFFHWHVEFPEVFGDVNPGFDCILGNPPWERIKLQEKEFFEYHDPEIANAPNASARKKMIGKLRELNPSLAQVFENTKRLSETESLFLRNSQRFPLTGKGDINTYTVFTEHARTLLNKNGQAGIIVPTGIATDKTTSEFFGDIVDKKSLTSLYDFENKKGYFPIHKSFKFCLITMCGENASSTFDLAFFLNDVDDLNDEERHFSLTSKEIRSINPNTLNCPIFRNKHDAEITKDVYKRVSVLVDETKEETENSWGISFLAMFHMTNDSGLFKTKEQLEEAGFESNGNQYINENERYLPLYESKMFWQFDHRFGSFEGVDSRSDTHLPTPSNSNHFNPEFLVQPWYWVTESEMNERVQSEMNWLLVFRDITGSVNERTGIFSILPMTALGNNAPLILFKNIKTIFINCFIANLNSIIFDFITRQKVGGTHINFFILKQFPLISNSFYNKNLINLIAPKTIELTYTAWDLEPFAQDVLKEIGADTWNQWFPQNPLQNGRPQPFRWDEERRALLRAELDAIYAHLYGISRDDLDYILDTFPIVKKKDEAKYGTYRTKDLILQYYDEYEGKIEPVSKEEN